MKCFNCHGEMKYGSAPFHIDRNNYHLILDIVPAWVCTQCGEVLYEEKEVDSIQEALSLLDSKVNNFAIAV